MTKNKYPKAYLLLACILLFALVLTGCAGTPQGGTPTTAPTAGAVTDGGSSGNAAERVFRLRLSNDPPSADPKDFNSTTITLSFYNCYDTLLNFSSDGSELLPGLATSWEQVDDTTYVYQIREGVKFSDGSDMTIDDVVYSFNRIKDPATAASMSYLFDRVASFEKTGDWELTVKLSEPDATWKYVPATSPCTVVSQAAVEKYGDKYGTAEVGTVGTGPYKLEPNSWASGSEIVLVPNEFWWGDAETRIFDKVVYSIIVDNTAAALAAQSGQLDFVHGVNAATYSIYRGISTMNFINYPSTTSSFLALNTAKPPMDDVHLRRACAYAINKEALAKTIGGEFAKVSGGVPMPDTMFYMDPEAWLAAENNGTIESYSYNLDKAREELALSAYPDGTTVIIYTSAGNKPTAEAVQAFLKEINVTANINEFQPSEQYEISYGYKLDENGNRLYDIYITGWLSDYLDPIGYLTPFWSNTNIREGGSNQAVYNSSEVQALIDASYLESDDKVRSDMMIEAFRLAALDCPYITEYDTNAVYALSKEYDYLEGPMFFWNFDLTDIKPAK